MRGGLGLWHDLGKPGPRLNLTPFLGNHRVALNILAIRYFFQQPRYVHSLLAQVDGAKPVELRPMCLSLSPGHFNEMRHEKSSRRYRIVLRAIGHDEDEARKV